MPSPWMILRLVRRHLRAGELHLLLLALVLAVASLSSVSFLTERMGRALEREANQMLGGDLLLAADHPWDPAYSQEMARLQLRRADTWLFTSMVSKGEALQLAGVKAVGPAYPLRGVLRLREQSGGPDRPAPGIPERGQVWLDERLAGALNASPGDVVSLGRSRLRVAALVAWEADRGNNFFALAPRLVMNLEDVAATGLVVEGSRVTYRLHGAGEADAVATFAQWARGQLGKGEQMEDVAHARPELRTALDRANRFLRLSALLAVILAAVAVGLTTRRYVERQLDACAVMRCLGASQGLITRIFLGAFLLLGLLCGLIGSGLGYLAQFGLEQLLQRFLAVALPRPSLLPVVQGMATALALLCGFAMPYLGRLGRVSTLRVLRQEWQEGDPSFRAAWGTGLLVLAGLMLWVAEDWRLGLMVLLGFLGAVLVYWVMASALLHALLALRPRLAPWGDGWRLGLAALMRHRRTVSLQMVALALGMTALLMLSLVRGNLLEAWQASVPPDAPNRFLLNIQDDERAGVQAVFRQSGMAPPEMLPMIRGRLVEKNGQALRTGDFKEDRARHLLSREFNLSWAQQLPAGNQIVAGNWFPEAAAAGWSVEEGIARTLGLGLGDRLSFDIAGSRVEGPITSLRKLAWDSMRVNFFVIAPPGVLENFPSSYISSFHLKERQAAVGRQLIQAYPTLTLIDISELLDQLQSLFQQLSLAVQCVFLFTLGAGLLVLTAAIQSGFEARTQETVILRTLGARHGQLIQSLLVEFALLGGLAALLAVVGSSGMAWGLAHFLLKLSWAPDGWICLMAMLMATTGVAGLAYLWLKTSLRVPIRSLWV